MRWGVAIDLARSKATGRVDMTSSSGSTPPLSTHNLSVGYGKNSLVLQDVTVAIPVTL
ncbi:hypothetical protein CRES_1861 [Corynebacterium resistens DSM 45100]|uniref:Uncharacterized protein n=1 Tax=Corynebacterium resistens (strain DSM 45100 / JCM 12819 / GTC 2026 / SICGH 158) TaxID=662755 RepID=F8E296_CORRG|nr:hypothetical protein CRES_1861 [Corynebacterium resistens DSM 45100]